MKPRQNLNLQNAFGLKIMAISETWLGDNLQYMSKFPDKFFDLAIPDPEYGIGQPKQSNLKGYNGRASLEVRLQKNRLNQGGGKLKDRVLNKSNTSWDNAPPPPEYFKELFRVSKNQIIWGGNYFPLPPSRCWICWDKCQPWENFSQIELAWTSFDNPAALFKFDNRTGGKIHPTQKPIELYLWELAKFAEKGFKILDPNLGSQSSRIASYDLDIDFYGCENDEDYFNDGNARFEAHRTKCEELKQFGYAKTELRKINPTLF